MRKIIYPLFVFGFLFGLVSCSETSEASMSVKKSKESESESESDEIIVNKVIKIKTITWDEAKEYGNLKEKDFLANELFNKPDKTKIDTNDIGIVHTYYYKKKLDAGYGTKRDWFFSFTKGNCFSHGWAMKAFK